MNLLDRFPVITSLHYSTFSNCLYVKVKPNSDITKLKKFLNYTYLHSFEITNENNNLPKEVVKVHSLVLRNYFGFYRYLYELPEGEQLTCLLSEVISLNPNEVEGFYKNLDFAKLHTSTLKYFEGAIDA
jgi:hypothetical protein